MSVQTADVTPAPRLDRTDWLLLLLAVEVPAVPEGRALVVAPGGPGVRAAPVALEVPAAPAALEVPAAAR